MFRKLRNKLLFLISKHIFVYRFWHRIWHTKIKFNVIASATVFPLLWCILL